MLLLLVVFLVGPSNISHGKSVETLAVSHGEAILFGDGRGEEISGLREVREGVVLLVLVEIFFFRDSVCSVLIELQTVAYKFALEGRLLGALLAVLLYLAFITKYTIFHLICLSRGGSNYGFLLNRRFGGNRPLDEGGWSVEGVSLLGEQGWS